MRRPFTSAPRCAHEKQQENPEAHLSNKWETLLVPAAASLVLAAAVAGGGGDDRHHELQQEQVTPPGAAEQQQQLEGESGARPSLRSGSLKATEAAPKQQLKGNSAALRGSLKAGTAAQQPAAEQQLQGGGAGRASKSMSVERVTMPQQPGKREEKALRLIIAKLEASAAAAKRQPSNGHSVGSAAAGFLDMSRKAFVAAKVAKEAGVGDATELFDEWRNAASFYLEALSEYLSVYDERPRGVEENAQLRHLRRPYPAIAARDALLAAAAAAAAAAADNGQRPEILAAAATYYAATLEDTLQHFGIQNWGTGNLEALREKVLQGRRSDDATRKVTARIVLELNRAASVLKARTAEVVAEKTPPAFDDDGQLSALAEEVKSDLPSEESMTAAAAASGELPLVPRLNKFLEKALQVQKVDPNFEKPDNLYGLWRAAHGLRTAADRTIEQLTGGHHTIMKDGQVDSPYLRGYLGRAVGLAFQVCKDAGRSSEALRRNFYQFIDGLVANPGVADECKHMRAYAQLHDLF